MRQNHLRFLLKQGCFPLCQRFRKFRSDFKCKGPFRFLPTGISGITSGGGPLISVGILRPKFAVPLLTNRFFALIREFGKGTKSSKSHSYWVAWFNRKMPFHFPRVFPLISDQSVWHNDSTPGVVLAFPFPYKDQLRHHFNLSNPDWFKLTSFVELRAKVDNKSTDVCRVNCF